MPPSSGNRFPLPFPSLRTQRGNGDAPYIVGAMFTATYADMAARLATSCRRFNLPYDLHEVPTVHRSMSVQGSDDLRFTKANFIHHLLSTHKRPVLYLDADCEFVAQPSLLSDIARDRCDFAIYNWLADAYNDRFYPVPVDGIVEKPYRFFQYTGNVDRHSTTQLMGAGLTQFYRNSMAARALLAEWHRTVSAFPGCGDDNCLNYTYNNLSRRHWLRWVLKSRWLPKSYARVMFWMYEQPVINHADIPTPGIKFPRLRCPPGRQEVYSSLTKRIEVPLPLPRDCVIDTKEGYLYKLVSGKHVQVGKTSQRFWV